MAIQKPSDLNPNFNLADGELLKLLIRRDGVVLAKDETVPSVCNEFTAIGIALGSYLRQLQTDVKAQGKKIDPNHEFVNAFCMFAKAFKMSFKNDTLNATGVQSLKTNSKGDIVEAYDRKIDEKNKLKEEDYE